MLWKYQNSCDRKNNRDQIFAIVEHNDDFKLIFGQKIDSNFAKLEYKTYTVHEAKKLMNGNSAISSNTSEGIALIICKFPALMQYINEIEKIIV